VFGLQASGIDGVSPPHKTIEEMAAAYLAEVRGLQPRGPYLLGGYSGGGLVAFEMARRLTDSGETVGLLALIDTFHPEMALHRLQRSPGRLERLRMEGVAYLSGAFERRLQSRKDAKDARIIDEHLARGEAVPLALRDHYLSRNFACAARLSVPKPWTGRATLFRAERVDRFLLSRGPAYGWDREILGGVEIMTVPGDHATLVLGSNAECLVRFLSAAIARVSPSFGS
jgi:thioesterase domain-containing protein